MKGYGLWRRLCWGNAWVPVSWGAFLLLQMRFAWRTGVAWALAMGVSLGVLALPPLWRFARETPKGVQVFAALTAAGILQASAAGFLWSLGNSERVVGFLGERSPGGWAGMGFAVVALALMAGAPALFVALAALYRWMTPFFAEVWRALSRPERGMGLMCVAGLCLLALWALPQTRAFWANTFDVVYTADPAVSPAGNAFLHLSWPENDLRQPLFAAVAAPWEGAPSLLAQCVCPWVPWAPAFAAAVAQSVAMVFGVLLLARMVGLRGDWARATFVAWVCSGYGMALFCVQPEQYAFAFAGLMLFLATCHAGLPGLGRLRVAAFVGAAGTLVTSAAAVVFVLPWRVRGGFRAWVRPWLGLGVAYGLGMLLFIRFDQVLLIQGKWEMYRSFSGAGLAFTERLGQWVAFVAMTVMPPEAEPLAQAWRLPASPAWGFWPGVAVLSATLLCGLALARRDFARICLA